MRSIFLIIAFLLFNGCLLFAQNTQVLVLPAIHGAHNSNPNFTYEDLFAIIHNFKPDKIGVEIRPEDMLLSSEELDIRYPIEMIMVRDSFPDKSTGIDFYADEFVGKQVTVEIFRDTGTAAGRFKYLQQKMNEDSLILAREELLGIDSLLELQSMMAMTFSPKQFLEGKYDRITRVYDTKMRELLQDTPYYDYYFFNENRDRHITQNGLKLVDDHLGRRILILVGANHRYRLMDSLQTREVMLVNSISFSKSTSTMNKPINENAPVIQRQNIFIDAAPKEVWQVLTGIAQWPQWQSDISEAKLEGPLAEGTTFRWKAGGLKFKSEIHTKDEPLAFGWTGSTFGAYAIHNWQFENKGGGTVVYVEESLQGFFPALMKRKFSRDLERGMRKNLEELKVRVEGK